MLLGGGGCEFSAAAGGDGDGTSMGASEGPGPAMVTSTSTSSATSAATADATSSPADATTGPIPATSSGTTQAVADSSTGASTTETGNGIDEVCDGIDNDGDGGIDEGSPANPECGGCTFVLSDDGDHYFALCPDAITYDAARVRCMDYGLEGDLAILDNAIDHATVFALIDGDTWIGLSDAAREGHWVWVDGTDAIVGGVTMGYDGWAGGEPNGGTTESCGELDLSFDGWIDVACDQSQAYLCRHAS